MGVLPERQRGQSSDSELSILRSSRASEGTGNSILPPLRSIRAPTPTTRPPASSMTRMVSNVEPPVVQTRSEKHTSELQSRLHLVCRLLLEKKKKIKHID